MINGVPDWNHRCSDAEQRPPLKRSLQTISNRRPVLIISTVVDAATDAVVDALSQMMVPTLRVNTEDFPFSGKIDYRPGCAEQHLFEKAESFRSIWYRRVRVPARPPQMDPGLYEFCVRESRNALLGGILGLRCRWMSRPEVIWKAEFKPYQLDVAAALGIATPRTLISNVPDSIREFFAVCGQQMIAKPVRSGHMVKNGTDHAIYTTKIAEDDLEPLDDAALSPTIFQEFLPKRFDVRVTVVGRRVFAAAIDSQTDPDARVDWRRTSDPKLPHHRIELPTSLQQQVIALMDALNLEYGALDFVLTPDGRFVFLEINPNGQWLWLDDILSLGITTAIAEWLSDEVE